MCSQPVARMHAVILYCTSGSFLPLYSLSLSLHVLFLFGWTSRCPCKLALCSLNKGMKETDWPWSSGGIPHAHGASSGPISPSLAYLSSNALKTRVITSSEPGLPGFLISFFIIIMNCLKVVLFFCLFAFVSLLRLHIVSHVSGRFGGFVLFGPPKSSLHMWFNNSILQRCWVYDSSIAKVIIRRMFNGMCNKWSLGLPDPCSETMCLVALIMLVLGLPSTQGYVSSYEGLKHWAINEDHINLHMCRCVCVCVFFFGCLVSVSCLCSVAC